MVIKEITSPRLDDIEVIEQHKPKNTKSREKLIDRESNAKSMNTLLASRISLFKKDYRGKMNQKIFTPADMILFLEMLSNKNREFKKQNSKFIEIEIVEGWKGKFSIEIFPEGFSQDFKILQNIKDKETGEIEQTSHLVPCENVNKLLQYISTWKIKESHKCYDFTELLGEKSWQDVIGKRTDVYFPKYYFPIKVLESLKIISYSGKGVITRLL